jgi:hypothetical protein
MFEVYCWDGGINRFRVEGVFQHRGAAEVVAGRLSAESGNLHFVRPRAA